MPLFRALATVLLSWFVIRKDDPEQTPAISAPGNDPFHDRAQNRLTPPGESDGTTMPAKATSKKTATKKKSTDSKAPAISKADANAKATGPAKSASVKSVATKKKAATTAVKSKKAATTGKTRSPAVAAEKTVSARSTSTATPKKKVAVKNTATKKMAAEKASQNDDTYTSDIAPKKKTVKKSRKSVKATDAPLAEDVLERPEKSKPAETKTTKTAAKKTATKKTATRKKATKAADKPRPPVIGKVGQAPRRSASDVTASNPFPVPPKLHEDLEPKTEKPSAVSKEAKKDFKVKDQIVYPAHGVGIIETIERQEIVGTAIEVFVIRFDHEKLTLRLPTEKAKSGGMRALSEPKFVDKCINVLQGRARIKRTMWSRRAQEYEAKINSGDLNAVAEVVRDLYRAPDQPEQSYSERQLFEQALDRMAREVAAVRKSSLNDAIDEVHASLQKKEAA